MEKDIENEEKLKDKIFAIYSTIKKELSSDRRQVYIGQLWENIIKWYGKYLSIDAHEMGKEVFDIIRRITREGNNSNIPGDKDEFFRYLSKSLNTGENEYFRNFDSGIIGIPKEETDIFNSLVIQSYMTNNLNNPQDKYFSKLDYLKIKNTIELVLEKSQDRTRECYRSLFTAYCIDKSIMIEEIIPLLDNEMLEGYQKDGKKPKNYDIYLRYHPEIKKDSAGVRASDMLKKFLNSLNTALKEKEWNIFTQNH